MADSDAQPHGNPFVALAIVLTAAFMVLLDISIVNVAIPSIQRELHATFSQIQWVVAGYQLAYGVMLITGGRLGDIVGRKRMFMLGVGGFTVASMLCGISQSGTQIVAFRVFQGLMASMMFPQIFSIITVAFPQERRALALGILGGVIGVATITGPLLGGILIQLNILNLDWRPIFLINVPIGALAILAAALRLGESRPPQAPKLDPLGVVIATTGLFLFIFPLVEGRDVGWPWWTYGMLAAAVLVLAGFVVFERRREATGKDPLVLSSLFDNRSFVIGLFLFIVFFSGLPSTFFTLSIFLQVGLGYSALTTGLTTFPFAFGSGLASGVSIRLVPRFGRKVLSAGSALASIGILGVIFTIHQAGTGLQGWHLIPALFVAGTGLGLTLGPSLNFVLAGISHQQVGSASGVLTTVQQIGGAIGIAVVGVIFFGLISSNAGPVTDDLKPRMTQQLVALGMPQSSADRVFSGFQTCYKDRAAASDPTVNPPSCIAAQNDRPPIVAPGQPQPTPQQATLVGLGVRDIALSNLDDARKQTFVNSIQGSLLYNAGVWGLCFFLLFLLPRPVRPPALAPQPVGVEIE